MGADKNIKLADSDTIVTGDTDLLVMGTCGRIKIQRAADFLASQRQIGRARNSTAADKRRSAWQRKPLSTVSR